MLLPDAAPDSRAFNLLVREVVREMTVKSGQKCTAIRRILVPTAVYDAAAEAIGAKLAAITVGNPRNDNVRMGSLVSRAQLNAVREGLEALKAQATVLHDGSQKALVDADPAVAACIGPMLLGAHDADAADRVHDVEVFGPVATLLPYRDLDHAHCARTSWPGFARDLALWRGRCGARPGCSEACRQPWARSRHHAEVAQAQTGHGNVMPMSLHGGPGRAGGGAELGGLRALDFYHRRSAVQASPGVLAQLGLQ